MASSRSNTGNTCSSIWTVKQNKIFENALALIEEERKDRWQVIARMVGDKTSEEVENHYQILLEDLANIESGYVSDPYYQN
ncbi:protein RADIALIS-like 3 [Senna tora]|uniref:Protein RADIALIS-like 3 n=1 Tax=Senna tora TaxID=362788 RepID=A0A834U2F2_9FABA|nr:protein RADIALIS-like 3 [Senna tora]